MNNFVKDHISFIKNSGISNPELELRALLNKCSVNRDEIFLNNFEMNKINLKKFQSAFKRRVNHEPLSKIFNNKEFWSLSYYVDQSVIDPRPESEFLISSVTDYFTNIESEIKICDLGTGSGCLAITLATIYKSSKIAATDISKEALIVARKNAQMHNVKKNINFFQCNWIDKKEKFDIIISNPPYLSSNEYKKCQKNIKNFEPKKALVGGKDGLRSYRQISKIISSIMSKNSLFFIEIGEFQKDAIKQLFTDIGLKIIKIVKDYQKIDRVLVFKKV